MRKGRKIEQLVDIWLVTVPTMRDWPEIWTYPKSGPTKYASGLGNVTVAVETWFAIHVVHALQKPRLYVAIFLQAARFPKSIQHLESLVFRSGRMAPIAQPELPKGRSAFQLRWTWEQVVSWLAMDR